MATIVAAPPALSGDLSVFHTTDPLLANAPLLLFHGAAATVGAASSRIQLHIFTIGGNASYSRLAVSPTSPFYSAVTNLPREEQGDEICRSIAFGLRKYFEELSPVVKEALCTHAKSASSQLLWGDNHIAILASRLKKVENKRAVAGDVVRCFAEQKLSWLDIDVKLPPGTIKELPKRSDSAASDDLDEYKLMELRYGKYASIISRMGDPIFMPTSKMKRAPSKVSAIGRSASFMRQQRENARKEVVELVSTESSYVDRLHELRTIRDDSVLNSDQTSKIFPTSLDDIIRANEDLQKSLQQIINDTAASSSAELQGMQNEQPNAQQIRQDLLADSQGIGAVGKCLAEKLPGVRECYGSYMRDHAQATQQLRSVLRNLDGGEQSPLLEVGEQKLTSLLIEPVQRLPRYSLYIDSISTQLPTRHPALKHLLKAKDIVTSICEQSDGDALAGSIANRLSASVDGWPANTVIAGRLVTAVDVIELQAPFSLHDVIKKGILLVFTSGILLLEKASDQAVSARTLMTELESLSGRQPLTKALTFSSLTPLNLIDLSESHEGQSVQIVTHTTNVQLTTHTLLLEGSYEGKAARLVEEIVNSRVEARFSETEREGQKWEVRATDFASGQFSVLSAVFEDSHQACVSQRQGPADVQMIIDIDKHSQRVRASQQGPHTVIAVSPLRDGNYRLSVDTVHGPGSSEQVSVADMLITIQRKLTLIHALKVSMDRPELVDMHINRHRAILQSIKLDIGVNDEATTVVPQPVKTQRPRPLSPVKMLSSLLSSTNGLPPNTLKKEASGSSLMTAAASFSMLPASRSNSTISKPPSREGRPASRDQTRPVSMISTQSTERFDASKKLQDTMSSYLLALKARKGNIVGRSLKMRSSADELAVNELYNTMLENSQMMISAAQAPVDVLFAAFEKFLHVAWPEQYGPVLPAMMLEDIQAKAESLFPAEFDEHCRLVLRAQALPNQRAFKGIISLLNDLLDGTGNDADRGALTAAFAELLITEGDPHDFVSLLDRFVDDVETYFGEPLTEQGADEVAAAHKRSRSVNTGSLTSNTSSLRKRFGLGLSRENSKSEHEAKGSVWRTLSKSRQREPSPADSLSRSTMQRARSTESEYRALSRPVSQDGPRKDTTNDSLQVPTVMPSMLPGLTTIGEHPSFIPTGPPRQKRRSSLSDLKMLDTPFATPQRPLKSPPTSKQLDKSLPGSPIPSTPSSKGGSLRITSPLRSAQRPPLPASFRKEASSPATVIDQAIQALSKQTVLEPDHENLRPTPTRIRQGSNIPSLATRSPASKMPPPITPVRNGLSERHDAGNIIRKPASGDKILQTPTVQPATGSPTKKLKMQSPQKIRERLQVEQSAIVAAHSHLQDELSKISDELTMTPNRLVPGGSQSRMHSTAGGARDLTARVLKMETSNSEQLAQMTAKLESIKSDVSTSLSVSEAKCKKLDELYRESNAENEILYARFNAELARVSKAVKGGDGIEELKRRLKEQEDEISRLKKDNVRLKREVVGLRAQLRE